MKELRADPEDVGVLPEAVDEVGGVLVDVDLHKEPHKLHQLDLGIHWLLVTCIREHHQPH